MKRIISFEDYKKTQKPILLRDFINISLDLPDGSNKEELIKFYSDSYDLGLEALKEKTKGMNIENVAISFRSGSMTVVWFIMESEEDFNERCRYEYSDINNTIIKLESYYSQYYVDDEIVPTSNELMNCKIADVDVSEFPSTESTELSCEKQLSEKMTIASYVDFDTTGAPMRNPEDNEDGTKIESETIPPYKKDIIDNEDDIYITINGVKHDKRNMSFGEDYMTKDRFLYDHVTEEQFTVSKRKE